MKLLLLFSLICFATFSKAQMAAKDSLHVADSLAKAKTAAYEDSIDNALLAKTTYPLIKTSKWSGVITVSDIDEKPDAAQRYKILMEITTGIKDTAAAKEINGALAEVGRQINLHVAAGVPKKNLDIVVAHGGVLKSFYTDSLYKKNYKIKNPNDSLFNELRGAGVKFIACGQAMNFMSIEKPQLFSWVKVALSAQTVITDYQLKGYIFRRLN